MILNFQGAEAPVLRKLLDGSQGVLMDENWLDGPGWGLPLENTDYLWAVFSLMLSFSLTALPWAVLGCPPPHQMSTPEAKRNGQKFLKLEPGYSCFSFQLFEVFCHSSACSHTNGAHACVCVRAHTLFPILIFWDTFNSSFYTTSTLLLFLCPSQHRRFLSPQGECHFTEKQSTLISS